MSTVRFYSVARHTFALRTAGENDAEQLIPSLRTFASTDGEAADALFELTLLPELSPALSTGLLVRFGWEDAECSVHTTAQGYELQIVPQGEKLCHHMQTNATFTRAVAGVDPGGASAGFLATNFLMMLYAFATAPHHTLMFHASAVCLGRRGYLFLGKSGTGKSTHSRLWLEHVAGSELLNDDNPIVRLMPGGEAWVFGSPWSGKTPCYHNRGARVGGIVRLAQAPHNRMEPQRKMHAFTTLLPACSCLRADEGQFDAVVNTVGLLATAVPVYTLECLPAPSAALLCHATLCEAEKEERSEHE